MVSAPARTLVVDCDTHFWEPLELWESYIDPKHHDAVVRRLKAVTPSVASDVTEKVRPYMSIRGGDDPEARLEWMDEEGIFANIIYPGASGVFTIPDPEAQAAACRAVNRWAADFASRAPHRLKPCILLPLRYPDRAIAELRFATETLGLEVVYGAPTPAPERRWSDPALDPVWGAMQDAGVVMTFHEFTRGLEGSLSRPTYQDFYPLTYLCGHSVEAQVSVADLLLGGVFERFPRLQFGFVEAHVAWLPGWLALLDDSFPRTSTFFKETKGTGTLSMTPSDFFRRQGFIVAFPDDAWVEEVVKYVGADNIVLSSDYPHPQTRYRLASQLDEHQPALAPNVRRKILGENAARIFRLSPA
jgi:predicted TIM-barrel fold metal-dependent hydrolase